MYKFMNPYHSAAGSTTLFLAQLPGLICGSLKDEHEAVPALHQEIQVFSLSSLFATCQFLEVFCQPAIHRANIGYCVRLTKNVRTHCMDFVKNK